MPASQERGVRIIVGAGLHWEGTTLAPLWGAFNPSQNDSLAISSVFTKVTTPLLSPIKMLFTCYLKLICVQLFFFQAIAAQSLSATRKAHQPEYVSLPPLREQEAIKDAWTAQRIANIPNILQKYGVDAWLVRLLSCFTAPVWDAYILGQMVLHQTQSHNRGIFPPIHRSPFLLAVDSHVHLFFLPQRLNLCPMFPFLPPHCPS